MRMLRTPPFFPPNRGKNHIWKYFPDLACGAVFRMIKYTSNNFCIQIGKKTCQLIPNQWNFTSATLNHIRFVLHNIKNNERKKSLPRFVDNWKHRFGLESARAVLCKWATCTSRLSVQKLLQNRSTYRNYTKTMFGKRVMTRTHCR